MKPDHSRRYLQLFEALSVVFALCDMHMRDLEVDIHKIKDDPTELLRVLASCWSIVDCVHRTRELSQSVPGLSRNDPSLRKLLSATKSAEEFRHYIQHLRNELSNPDSVTTPVWGSLSWVDEENDQLCYTAMIGTMYEGTNHYSCVYDRYNNRWVSRVALTVKGTTFNFDPAAEAVAEFRKFILNWIIHKSSIKIEPRVEFPIVSCLVDLS
ncbi:hypothetical protein [Thalassospira sp.]|uniref:hypothetical protein n=1 Tax=Thalassospira sp. TaxID=1912094 RepID=UPI0025FBEF26|nr:hypothetical protein [Thalassospira sp.]|tara:strand:+ start:232 stop:864 length:633 start_codon:yes stop_codon:yes gene_type:complete